MKLAVEVEGVKDLRRSIRQAKDADLAKQLRETHKRLAEEIVALALPHVPVRTGRLKRSVRALARQDAAMGKAGGARVPYAAAIHWGWPARNIRRRAFLWEAGQVVEQRVVERFADDIEQILDQVRSR